MNTCAPHGTLIHNTTLTYLLLEPDLLLLHQLTLPSGLGGVRQQLKTACHMCLWRGDVVCIW